MNELTKVINDYLTPKMNNIFTDLQNNLHKVNKVDLKVDEGLTLEYENGVYYLVVSVYITGSSEQLLHYKNHNTQIDTLITKSINELIQHETTTLLSSYFIHKLVKKLYELKGQL